MGHLREGRWLCPSCGRENLGRYDSCEAGCGKARPKGVRFYLPENSPIITNPDLLAKGQEAANWFCDYCGGANPGSVNGAKVVACAHCGQARDANDADYETREYTAQNTPRTAQDANPKRASRQRASRTGTKPRHRVLVPLVKIFAVCLVLALVIASFLTPVSTTSSRITDLSWHRQVEVMALKTLRESDWTLPDGATLISSERKVRGTKQVVVGYVSDTRTEMKSVKVGEQEYVCGHKDLGNGFFKDIKCTRDITKMKSVEVPYQRPVTEDRDIIATWYVYDIDRWVRIDTLEASGNFPSAPVWPEVEQSSTQHAGSRHEQYTMMLEKDDGTQKSMTISFEKYKQYRVGDQIEITHNIWGSPLHLEYRDTK